MVADRDRNAFASQLAVFRSSPDVISRILRKGGSVLLAAKVLVISRLLHKKLQDKEQAAVYIESHRARLAKLRRRLLASIDNRFKSSAVDVTGLLDAMCAFSLATSSSAMDVLRHFHYVRSEGIAAQLERQGENGENVLRALQLWIRSIQDTQAIFPKQLSSALVSLKSTPLWDNLTTQTTFEMNHDVHSQWIGDDIRYFTPYIRHDDLQNDAMRGQLATWTRATLSQYLDRVRSLLDLVPDPTIVVELRQKTLELWFSSQGKITGIDKSHVFDSLRQAFMGRLLQLVQSRCSSLAKVSSRIRAVLENWQESSNKVAHLWNDQIVSMETSKGGRRLIEAIKSTMHGRTTSITASLEEYRIWLDGVDVLENIIQKLRDTQWEEDVDDIDDDEDSVDQRHIILSQDDPQELEDVLKAGLAEAFSKMEGDVSTLVNNVGNEGDSSKAVFFIRVLRGIKENKPLRIEQDCFSIDSVDVLQETIAAKTVTASFGKCGPRILVAMKRDTVPEKALWEGDPELPILPSSWAFTLLRGLMTEMADIGNDIWSPQAVKKVKIALRGALRNQLSTELCKGAIVNGESSKQEGTATEDGSTTSDGFLANGNADETPTSISLSKLSNDRKIQNLFDLLYLDNATSLSKSHMDNFHQLLNVRRDELRVEAGVERLEKSAAEYWNRTKLLFGLLV